MHNNPKISITPAYRTAHNKNYDTSDWIKSIGHLSLRQIHEADVAALHHIGTRGLCTIIKNRFADNNLKIYLDQLPSYLVNIHKMPRKRKKALKQYITQIVNDATIFQLHRKTNHL